MRNNGYYIIAVVLAILPIFASCRKELCYDHYPAINVTFSWEREWERDYGMSLPVNWDSGFYGFGYDELRPSLPEWVMMVKYSDDGDTDERFLPTAGGRLILSESKQQSFLFYNGDTEYIIFSDMASFPEARASATSRSRANIESVVSRHPNSRTTNEPDALYSAFVKDVPAVNNHELRQIPVKMQPLVYTYVVRYEFERGIEHVRLARGALGGMAESVYLRDGKTSDESAIILYDCTLQPYGCEARVKSFGIPGFPDEYYGRSVVVPEERPYTLNLEVQLTNGKTVEFNFDISDQMGRQPRGGVIKVTGICIEDEQNQSDSGFEVDVSGWGGHEVIDLPVSAE